MPFQLIDPEGNVETVYLDHQECYAAGKLKDKPGYFLKYTTKKYQLRGVFVGKKSSMWETDKTYKLATYTTEEAANKAFEDYTKGQPEDLLKKHWVFYLKEIDSGEES
jgi:hypothetical protein